MDRGRKSGFCNLWQQLRNEPGLYYHGSMVGYGERLSANPDWALEQGARFFVGESDVNAALKRITERLDSLSIPYALVGGLALFQYGYRRFTEDVDRLVKKDDLKKLHEALEGHGYLPKFPGAKIFGIPKAVSQSSFWSLVRIPAKSNTYSNRNRTLVPIHFEQ